MPTLPLFDSSLAAVDAPHRVKAPGGYEVWRFAAHDPASQTWITASFQFGFPSPQYLRRYLRYRVAPTRFAPPLPEEYPVISIAIYSHNRFYTSTVRFKPAEFIAAELGIHFGSYGFVREKNDTIHVRAPDMDLSFRALFSQKPFELSLLPRHRCVLTDGLCAVSGTIQVGQTKIALAGKGFHDQQYGTEPMHGDSFRGHLFLKDKAIAFNKTEQMHVATFGTDSLPVAAEVLAQSKRRHTIWGHSYPRTIKFKDGLTLMHPRIINSRPIVAHVVYEAALSGEKGCALCEIGAARRLGWSILGV